VLAASPIGCASLKGSPVRSVEGPRSPATCDLRLYVEYVEKNQAYLSAVEVTSTGVTEGVCVKARDRALEIPERITLAGESLDALGYICEAEPRKLGDDARQACVWNHVVRNAYPLTFTLVAENGKISDYVALARVYRNGALLSRYNAASALKDPRVLEFSGEALAVSSSPFAARPPHLARMDLRVVPAGVSFDPALLEEELVSYEGRTRQRLTDLGHAVIGTLDPELGKNVACALERLRSIESQIKGFVTATPKAPVTSCPAGDVAAAPPVTAFRARFDKLTSATQGKLEQVTKDVDAELERGRSWLEGALEKVRADAKIPEFIAERATRLAELEQKLAALTADKRAQLLREADKVKAELDRARAALSRLDEAIDDAAKLMTDTENLARELRGTVRRALADKTAQVRAYDASVASLEKSGNLFEAYTDNPDVLAGEQRLAMRHGDTFQTFALAPWNGAVFRVAGELGTELNADNLIPIVDLFGVRVQWSDSRFSEFRAALGALYFRDKRTTNGVPEEDFTPAFQANVSLGTVKVGAAIAPWNPQHGDGTKAEKVLRILIGADLLKAISGTNVEAFTP
jgi:hypothetical protein